MDQRSLKQQFLEEPYRFDFFQAVRLLAQVYPDQKAVGGAGLPNEEPVRFRSNVTLDFPPSEIQRATEGRDELTDKERLEMVINFMGMVGSSGVLPIHYTELVLDRIRHRDTAMWAFLDIFTHRAASMFFRAWAKYRFPIAYERGDDEFTSYLFDLAGLGTPGLRGRMGFDDEALLPYVGLISQKPHSASALASTLADFFGVKARVIQFFGQWLNLTKSDITHLGQKNSSLARTALIGDRVWDQQSKFRVKLGPLPFTKFQAFLPTGTAHKPLRSLIRFMSGLEYDFDVQLSLQAKQVPGLILTTRAVRRPMLGWTTWLKTAPFTADDEQVVLGMDKE
jgi:type VI secretion system protein ImpH